MHILKSYQQPIPGNYFYVQSTGSITHRFDANPMVEEVAKNVSSFRIANKLPRASLGESLEDVDIFNCAVRNNDQRYCRECVESFQVARASHRFINRGCPGGCGKPVKTD